MKSKELQDTVNTETGEVVIYSTDWADRWADDWHAAEAARMRLWRQVSELHDYKQDADLRDMMEIAMDRLTDFQLIMLAAKRRATRGEAA